MGMKSLLSFKAKVIKPCSTLLSKLKRKFVKPSNSLRTPTFRVPRRRTKVVRFRKPFSIKSLGFHQCRPNKNKFKLRRRRSKISSGFKKAFQFKKHNKLPKQTKKPIQKVRIGALLTVLFSVRKDKDVEMDNNDQAAGDVSVSDKGNGKEPFPSPITPAFLRVNAPCVKDSSDDYEDEEVEEDEEDEEDEDENKGCKTTFENNLMEMIVEEGKVKDLMDIEELLFCWGKLKNPIFIELVSRFYGEICNEILSPSEDEHSQVSTITYYKC